VNKIINFRVPEKTEIILTSGAVVISLEGVCCMELVVFKILQSCCRSVHFLLTLPLFWRLGHFHTNTVGT
jgi:hypothetical protein